MIKFDPNDPYLPRRLEMVRAQLRDRGIGNARILRAFERVPRHIFVPREAAARAYEDHPVGIEENQTVSQPYMVAFMLEKLDLLPAHEVLEVGTGSGYQTALLAELAAHVTGVERFPSLATRARTILDQLEYKNVEVCVGDGSIFHSESHTYDRIIVSAASPRVPEDLVRQLRTGGRMIIPVGAKDHQILRIVTKNTDGVREEMSEACAFVPLIGAQGFPE